MTLTNRWPLVVSALPFNIMLSHKCVPCRLLLLLCIRLYIYITHLCTKIGMPCVRHASGAQTMRVCTHYIRVKVIVCRQHWSIETIQWIHLLTSILVRIFIFLSRKLNQHTVHGITERLGIYHILVTQAARRHTHTYTLVSVILFIAGVLCASPRLALTIIHFMISHLLHYFKTIGFEQFEACGHIFRFSLNDFQPFSIFFQNIRREFILTFWTFGSIFHQQGLFGTILFRILSLYRIGTKRYIE